MFILYAIPLFVFISLFKSKKISLNVLLLLIATMVCTWAAEVSTADGFIRDLGSSELIKEYERYALPGFAIVLGLIGVAMFIYATISLSRFRK